MPAAIGQSNLPDYQTVLWDGNKPYWKKPDGGKVYIAPAVGMSMFDDPRVISWAKQQGYFIPGGLESVQAGTAKPQMASQSGGIFHTTGTWDASKGEFESSIDWGNILTIAVASALTAGVASAAIGGAATGAGAAGGTSAAAGGTGAGVGLGEVGATAGLASGAGLPGAVAAPTLGALGTAGGVSAAAVPAITGPGAATAAGTGVGVGETAATTGLATGAGLPGATAIPTVADLATVGSSVPGIASAATIPAATGGSAASSLVPGLIKAGIPAAANIVGNILQKNAIGDAVDAQTAASAAGLAAQKAGDERAIGILSPWSNVGSAAVTRLGQLMGLTPQNSVPGSVPVQPEVQTGANNFVPNAVRNSPTASLVPQGPGPFANMAVYEAPDGSRRRVPSDQIAQVEAAGARRVS